MYSLRISTLLALIVAAAAANLTGSAEAARKLPPITNPTLVEDAPVVDVFEGMDSGTLAVRLIQHDEKSGNLFIENHSTQTVTVQLPDAFVGVHVLNQLGLNGGIFGQASGQGQGQGQSTGQVTGGGMSGGLSGGQNNSGGNFFSIPPERTVRVRVSSVCLEHGKPEPGPKMEYRIFPVEHVSRDPILRELLTLVARERVQPRTAQALAWHLANGKSWEELARMQHRQLASLPPVSMFTPQDLADARNVLKLVTERAERRSDEAPQSPVFGGAKGRLDTVSRAGL